MGLGLPVQRQRLFFWTWDQHMPKHDIWQRIINGVIFWQRQWIEREANGLTEIFQNKGLESCYMDNVLLQEYEQYAVQLVRDKKEEMGHHTNEVGRHMSCTPSVQKQRIRHSCHQESQIYQTQQNMS